MKRLNDILCSAFAYLIIVILSVLSLFSFISTTFVNSSDEVYYVSDQAYIHVAAFLLVIFIMVFFGKGIKVTDRLLLITGICITLALALFVYFGDLKPRFDQRAVSQVAAGVLNGYYAEYLPGGYAEIYPYQNGLVLLYEFIFFLAGPDNYIAIQYLNLLCMVASVLAIYFISAMRTKYFREITLAFILFMPYWGYVSFVYGNVPGFSLALWGLYFSVRFLSDYKILHAVIASILMSLACILKFNFAIMVIAIVIYSLMRLIEGKKLKTLLLSVLMVAAMMLGDLLVSKAIVFQTGIPLTEGIPSIPYIAMGLHEHNERGAGWHDDYPEDTYKATGHDPVETNKAAVEDIKASIENFRQHPGYAVGFFTRKIASMWNEPSFYSLSLQKERMDPENDSGFIRSLASTSKLTWYLDYIMNVFQSLIYLFSLLYFVYKRKNKDFSKFFFALYFLGGFLCHLLWEASSQYAVFYAMLLTPYAVIGIIETVSRIKAFSKRERIKYSVITVAVTLILSSQFLVNFLTLNRDNQRFLEDIVPFIS
ncbi:MAG: glycosyltransferase family 39 protein [Lachnospiraceae bacterium]|nr:glycosyltransferase family 39 protein [Lachnospiraceae bacterium]